MALQGKTAPPSKAPRKLRNTVLVILKLIISSVLLYLIISRTGIDKVASTLSGINLFSFFGAALIYVFSIYLSSIRWRLLLPDGQKKGRLFSLSLMGSFFNIFLPGIVGGDAVKAYYLNSDLKNNQDQKNSSLATAIASVFIDRYIGFCALILLGLTAFAFGFRYMSGSYIQWALPLITLLFVGGSVLVFWIRIGNRFKLISELYGYFYLYSKQKKVLVESLFLSLGVQVLGIIAVYILSLGLKIQVPLLSLFIFIPIISAITMIPISISGLGLREASFVLLLGLLNVSPAQATSISFAWFLSSATGSLTGLVEYMRDRKNR